MLQVWDLRIRLGSRFMARADIGKINGGIYYSVLLLPYRVCFKSIKNKTEGH